MKKLMVLLTAGLVLGLVALTPDPASAGRGWRGGHNWHGGGWNRGWNRGPRWSSRGWNRGWRGGWGGGVGVWAPGVGIYVAPRRRCWQPGWGYVPCNARRGWGY